MKTELRVIKPKTAEDLDQLKELDVAQRLVQGDMYPKEEESQNQNIRQQTYQIYRVPQE